MTSPSGITVCLTEIKTTAADRADLLDKSGWSPELSREQMLCLARFFKAYNVVRGETIFHEGSMDSSLAIVVEGKINIVKKDSHQHQRPLTVLGRGKALGEMSLVDGEPRSADAVAATDAIILVTTRDEIAKLTESYPKLGLRILFSIAATLSRRLRKTSGQLIEFMS